MNKSSDNSLESAIEKSRSGSILAGNRDAEPDDLLWRHLKTVPAFRALLRSTEARFIQQIDLPEPTLDLGCGDGHFASLAFDKKVNVGIDPWWGPLKKARHSDSYKVLVQGNGGRMPFPSGHFASIFSNSVLEHIDRVQPVLHEANRILVPGGRLVITTPSHHFTHFLRGGETFDRLRLKGFAGAYRRLFNAISRHAHTDPPETWATRLGKAGFAIERWQYYFSKSALQAMEAGHFQGLPSAILHWLTGHWILAPWESSLRRTEKWIRPFYEEKIPEEGAMLLFVARKESSSPLTGVLPDADPLTLSEKVGIVSQSITGSDATSKSGASDSGAVQDGPISLDDIKYVRDPEERSILPRKQIIPKWFLILSSLLSVTIAQVSARNQTASASGVLFWYGTAILFIGTLAYHRGKPVTLRFGSLTFDPRHRRRWLFLPAFCLTLLAYRLANNPGSSPRPTAALILWLLAIFLAMFSMTSERNLRLKDLIVPFLTKWEVVTLAVLFILALVVRFVRLTDHPFILSGSEASIGLDAMAVLRGQIGSPFATGWLTNPTLPLYLLAIPIKLIGPSVFAIRIVSTFVGAFTGPVIYLVGRKFWGPAVGLVATILLSFSHLTIHYSRIGLTNIWDPLVTMLALGLIYTAWQKGQRNYWLFAGAVSGLTIYFYTSSHLFPIMLAILSLFILGRWGEIREQRRNLLAYIFVFLIVSLPQILFYRSNPNAFMDRVNTVGILHSNWVTEESIRSGSPVIEILGQQLWRGLLAFGAGTDTSQAYNAGRPLLSISHSILLAIGLFLVLTRIRQFRHYIVAAWLGVALIFAGALVNEPVSSHRLLIASPVVYLLIGLAVVWLAQHLLQSFRVPLNYLLPASATVAVVLVAADVLFYFGAFQSSHQYGDRNTEIAHEAATYIDSLDGEWDIYFHGPPSMYNSFPTFAYLIEDWQTGKIMIDVPSQESPHIAENNKSTLYLVLPERSDEIPNIEHLNPGGSLQSFEGYNASPLFYTYEIR